uniref:Uncharacterized protein n=1 Tax=Setaria viridis TaxID=4556 RepID=A0A4U6V4E2_SETVI|nr:hypothetical protein SEVIR_4G217401v2 [Setaria viridis]
MVCLIYVFLVLGYLLQICRPTCRNTLGEKKLLEY